MENLSEFEKFIKKCTLPGFPGNKKEQEKLKKEKKEKKAIQDQIIRLKMKIPPNF